MCNAASMMVAESAFDRGAQDPANASDSYTQLERGRRLIRQAAAARVASRKQIDRSRRQALSEPLVGPRTPVTVAKRDRSDRAAEAQGGTSASFFSIGANLQRFGRGRSLRRLQWRPANDATRVGSTADARRPAAEAS